MSKGKQLKRKQFDVSNRTGQLNLVYERDRGICQICYLPCSREEASRDHIKELKDCTSKEEASDLSNIRLAHYKCNNLRSNRSPKDLLPEDYPDESVYRSPPLKQNLADKLRALGLITMDDLPA